MKFFMTCRDWETGHRLMQAGW